MSFDEPESVTNSGEWLKFRTRVLPLYTCSQTSLNQGNVQRIAWSRYVICGKSPADFCREVFRLSPPFQPATHAASSTYSYSDTSTPAKSISTHSSTKPASTLLPLRFNTFAKEPLRSLYSRQVNLHNHVETFAPLLYRITCTLATVDCASHTSRPCWNTFSSSSSVI